MKIRHHAPFLALFALVLCACSGDSGSDAGLFLGTTTDPVVIETACDSGLPDDVLSVGGLAIEGDTLQISVSYSGGCEDHEFALCWNGLFANSAPPQVQLDLHHDANGDGCEAAIARDVFADLAALREAQGSSRAIDISLAGVSETALYEF